MKRRGFLGVIGSLPLAYVTTKVDVKLNGELSTDSMYSKIKTERISKAVDSLNPQAVKEGKAIQEGFERNLIEALRKENKQWK